MIFDLNAFTEVERMRGDRLYLVREQEVVKSDSRYGAAAIALFEKKQVPGYTLNNRNSIGLPLAGGSQRYDASYYAYLNVYAGFEPETVTNKTFLMVNFEGLYELKYIESVRHFGRIFYCIYQLEETDVSKQIFDRQKRTLIDHDQTRFQAKWC